MATSPAEPMSEDELLARRIVVLRGELDDGAATEVIAKLLFLQSEDAVAPIAIYIDSPGGSVAASLAIRDTMDDVKPPVYTHGLTRVQGVAALLLAHGARGHRTVTAHAHVSFTPISGQGDTRRAEVVIVDMLAADTRQSTRQIEADLRASRRFDAEQARAYGLVDRVEP